MAEFLTRFSKTLPVWAVVLSGCADFNFTDPVTQETWHSLEGVKAIAPQITNIADPISYGQAVYHVGEDMRMLLRFEALADFAGKIATGDSRKIELLIYPDRELDAVPEGLRICPLAKNWMMLATWFKAHPFGIDGEWKAAGGDYHADGCESAEFDEGEDAEPALVFDLTRWFRDYPEAREENFGWILIATNPFSFLGETHSSRSPRIRFEKYVEAD